MSMTNINIRTDSDVKTQAQTLFNSLGLNMTTAINMFLRQSVRQQAIPLDFFLGDDGEETLAQSLADLDAGIYGLSLDEFDHFVQNVIRNEAVQNGWQKNSVEVSRASAR